MVVFTCNACSAVLKRNQVDKHSNQCRRCESLSCVDCGKDFWGDEYLQHMKCMTEEEKYCGKDIVPKVFKGEAKQEQWVEQVQAAIQNENLKHKHKHILNRLKDYPNIPRKKAKFQNFVKSCLSVHNPSLVSEVWDFIMGDKKEENGNEGKPDVANGDASSKQPDLNTKSGKAVLKKKKERKKEKSVAKGDASSKQPELNRKDAEADVLNKRERKKERRRKALKKEKKDEQEDEDLPVKSKKRKRNESDDEENPSVENGEAEHKALGKKNKKSKKKREALDEIENENNDDEETDDRLEDNEVEEEEEPPSKKKKMKFNWEQVIKSLLEKKGEMTLKKLRKKVLNEFAAQDCANYSEDNLNAKFDKKVLKIKGVKVYKDRATLKQ